MERPRIRSKRNAVASTAAPHALRRNTGSIAAAAWLGAREVAPSRPDWAVSITLSAEAARFVIEIFAEEWGYSVESEGKKSWIRVTDIPFVHGHDDFELLDRTPRLDSIRDLLRAIEDEQQHSFDRSTARIDSNIGGEEQIAEWVRTL